MPVGPGKISVPKEAAQQRMTDHIALIELFVALGERFARDMLEHL